MTRQRVPHPWNVPAVEGMEPVYFGTWGRLTVMVTKDRGKWHMSISHPTRYPTWDEIADARYEFVPDEVTMAMLLPPRRQYVNLHENCFHLHEIPTEGAAVIVPGMVRTRKAAP